MTTPDDFEGGPAGMIAAMAEKPDQYAPLTPLAQRGSTSVKLSRPQGDDEAAMAMKFGFSMPISQVSKLSQKMYGYMRDGNIDDDDEKVAIRGSNAINDLILMAACVTRQERYDEEEMRAQQWIRLVSKVKNQRFTLDPYSYAAGDEDPANGLDDDEYYGENIRSEGAEDLLPAGWNGHPRANDRPDINQLLDEWGEADAFMLQCRLDEERYGIDYAERYYDEYDRMEALRRDVEMRASKLSPPENMLFWCRVRQYKIMRERAFDLAMGYPVHDFTEVKRELAGGKDIHDLAHRMSWAFLVGYNRVLASMLDGKEYRMLLMAMIAGQIPVQQPQLPWGLPQGYWGGPPQQNGQGQGPGDGQQGDEGQDQDKRPAMFNIFRGVAASSLRTGRSRSRNNPAGATAGPGAGDDQEICRGCEPDPRGGGISIGRVWFCLGVYGGWHVCRVCDRRGNSRVQHAA